MLLEFVAIEMST